MDGSFTQAKEKFLFSSQGTEIRKVTCEKIIIPD